MWLQFYHLPRSGMGGGEMRFPRRRVRSPLRLVCQATCQRPAHVLEPWGPEKEPFRHFPSNISPSQLKVMETLTNKQVAKKGFEDMTAGELQRFFGILILITSFTFGSRAGLWSLHLSSRTKQLPHWVRQHESKAFRFNLLLRKVE